MALVAAVGVVLANKSKGPDTVATVEPEVTASAREDVAVESTAAETESAVTKGKPASESLVAGDEPEKKTVEKSVAVEKSSDNDSAAVPVPKPATVKKSSAKLPRLVDLGATKCIPCKMMAPILEELAEEYKGKLDVEFIDVWENQKAGQKYRIKSIPTQIFYDANGKEFFRHEGFFSKENILKAFEDEGIEL